MEVKEEAVQVKAKRGRKKGTVVTKIAKQRRKRGPNKTKKEVNDTEPAPKPRKAGRPRKNPDQAPKVKKPPRAKRLKKSSEVGAELDPREEHNRKERVRRAFIGKAIDRLNDILTQINGGQPVVPRGDKVRVLHVLWRTWENYSARKSRAFINMVLSEANGQTRSLNEVDACMKTLEELEHGIKSEEEPMLLDETIESMLLNID